MKPTNLIRSPGLTFLGAAIISLGGCDGGGDGDSATTVMTSATDSTSDTDTSTSTTDGGSESETMAETETGESTGEETTGPPAGGLGCGITPDCSKGTLDESIYQLTSSDQIEEISGYTKIFGSLEIDDTDLECLDFLACLEEVGGDVSVFGNGFLLDLSGTNNITDIGTEFSAAGSLVISDNAAMLDMNGFEELRQTTISLNITKNDAVEDITGLSELVAVQKDLTIRDNPELKALSGMHDLKAVGGNFVVTQNPNLCITEVAAVGEDLVQGPAGGSTEANDFDC